MATSQFLSCFNPAAIEFWLVSVQVLGVLSAVLVRVSEGSRRQATAQLFCLVCLMLVGTASVAALSISPTYSLSSGGVLAVMVLSAIWDSGRAVVGGA